MLTDASAKWESFKIVIIGPIKMSPLYETLKCYSIVELSTAWCPSGKECGLKIWTSRVRVSLDADYFLGCVTRVDER